MSEIPDSAESDAWASGADGSPEAMGAVQNALPVQLIATPWRDFKTCRPEDDLERAVGENAEREAPFDHLPVVAGGKDGRETIAGLIDLTPFRSGRNPQGESPRGIVESRMCRLSEDILIGAGASILDFVRTADRNPCRLVVSGSKIGGLVTLSDLQKLPVRAALFALITHAEMTMAKVVRCRFDEPDDWMALLSDGQKTKICKKIQKAIEKDSYVDKLLYTELHDKITIILKSKLIEENTTIFEESKTTFKTEMEHAKKLRNDVAHANDYALTPAAAKQVCKTSSSIEKWASRLTKWIEGANLR